MEKSNTMESVFIMRKLTFEEVKSLFEKYGYKLLETEYTNSKVKMRYICPTHSDVENASSVDNLKQGKRCYYCSKEKTNEKSRLTLEEVKVDFEIRGYILLDKEYKNNATKMEYTCPHHPNELTEISLANLRKGKGCNHCGSKRGGQLNRVKFEKVKELFETREYELLENEYNGNKHQMKYICKKHPLKENSINYHDLQSGRGCWSCRNEKLSVDNSGSKGPGWKGGTTPINKVLREKLHYWKRESLELHDYKCFVTGENGTFEIHHVTPFHVIRDNILRDLKLDMKEKAEDYSEAEVFEMSNALKVAHDKFVGYPILVNVHKLFHKLYGFIATEQDLFEFKERYVNGEFK